MASETHIPRVCLALSWPSLSSASAELCRPRPPRVGGVENPAVLSLVPPPAVEVAPGTSVLETTRSSSKGLNLR